jgi:predicted nucleic acid-binding protein
MRKVISNTTPILSLLKLGKLDLLEKLYTKLFHMEYGKKLKMVKKESIIKIYQEFLG